jgi:hypothetical protein
MQKTRQFQLPGFVIMHDLRYRVPQALPVIEAFDGFEEGIDVVQVHIRGDVAAGGDDEIVEAAAFV